MSISKLSFVKKPKVVVIGAGFGGLNIALSLKNKEVDVVLIDRTNYHLFQPLLYQVATAALSPGDIAEPIRGIFQKHKNVQTMMAEVTKIDRNEKRIYFRLGQQSIEYDYLVIATGARHSYFGKDEWEKYAPGLKTIQDAIKIRERVLVSFERAERFIDSEDIEKYLTFVVVGAGPTGVEMAGAIAEIAQKTMLKDFKRIDTSKTKIILVEGGKRVLPSFDPELSEASQKALETLGVTIQLEKMVTDINEEGVQIGDEFIKTPNIIWAAGNVASPILKTLDTELDRMGRAIVKQDCSITNDESVFVIGDACHFALEDGSTLPGIAPVAIQQGQYLADIFSRKLTKEQRPPFRYKDKGSMATIGRAKAVAQMGKFKTKGFFAWVMWLFVHILFLINFRKKYNVMAEWFWYYITSRHGVRLITNPDRL